MKKPSRLLTAALGLILPLVLAPTASAPLTGHTAAIAHVDTLSAAVFAVGGAERAKGLTLNVIALEMTVGEREIIVGTVNPTGAADKGVSYVSSDPGVAAVDADGAVTAVAAGSAVITATSSDGGYTDECAVTVSDKAVPVKKGCGGSAAPLTSAAIGCLLATLSLVLAKRRGKEM